MLSLLFRCLPRRLALALGAALGWIWYALIPVRRRVARDNLRLAFPERDDRTRNRIARRCLVNLAKGAVEILRLPGLTPGKALDLVEHQGWESYRRSVLLGRGVIIATAHFGNFDLMACVAAIRGVPLHVLTRQQHQPGVNRFWMSTRGRFGVRFLSTRDSALKIHRLLRAGEVVALMIDQHMPPGRGKPVDFFGRPAATTDAPALLAYTTGAPVLPVSIERLPGGRHLVRLDPPLQADRSRDRDSEVARITGELNRWLEGRIRELPDHWLWIHRRWKLPPGVVSLGRDGIQ